MPPKHSYKKSTDEDSVQEIDEIDEIDNEINYFKNDPENYIKKYCRDLSNLIHNVILYLESLLSRSLRSIKLG